VGFGEVMDRFMIFIVLLGLVAAFYYLDGRAKVRKKYRKPKYKNYKID